MTASKKKFDRDKCAHCGKKFQPGHRNAFSCNGMTREFCTVCWTDWFILRDATVTQVFKEFINEPS